MDVDNNSLTSISDGIPAIVSVGVLTHYHEILERVIGRLEGIGYTATSALSSAIFDATKTLDDLSKDAKRVAMGQRSKYECEDA